jgi:hypothetical protein
MSSLFTDSEKYNLSSIFNDIHDTFSRPIYIYKKAKQVVISNEPTHNFLWDSAPSNSTTSVELVSGVFNARILYGKEQKMDQFDSATNNNAVAQNTSSLEMGMVRIKLDPTGSAFIGDAQRVMFDNEIFEVTSSVRPHGLFTPQFYTYFLKKLN